MSRTYTIYITVLLVSCCQQGLATDPHFKPDLIRIIGGRTTTINNANYLVSLRDEKGDFFCGGSLVSYSHVVTAAHCLEGMRAGNIVVHAGATYLNEKAVTRTVVRISKPRVFNIETIMKDVAVLKLDRPMTGYNIAPIPLCSQVLPARSWVRIYGWGSQQENKNDPSNQLRVAEVRVLDHKKCAQSYKSVLKITNTMLCAALAGSRDSCEGDSGGPLEYGGQLCGIVSFGVGCAQKKFPGVYTAINSVKGFIQKAMQT